MGKTYISNAFPLQMLEADKPNLIRMEPVTAAEMVEALRGGFVSAVGHADTARVVSGLLGLDVPAQRINVRLESGDVLYVAQVTGGRLPEGATTLPEGVTLQFVRVTAD